MELFSRLSKLFHKHPRMSSVSVFRRADTFFVVTLHGSRGSDPCIEAGPLEVLPIGAKPADLGEAVFRGLDRTTYNYPYPSSKHEWKSVSEPLLSAAGCKSWSAFAKHSSNLRVNQVGSKLHVLPSARDAKGAFFPVNEREHHIEGPSAEQLGALVATELAFASHRDDA